MSVDEFDLQYQEYQEQFGKDWAIESLVDMPLGIVGPTENPEWMEWLCDTASKRLSPAQFAAWLRSWRQILDSSDPEVDAETLEPSRSSRVDDTTFTVHWAGKTCELGNTVLFRLMEKLASSTGRFRTFAALNDEMGRDNDEKFAAPKSRLCRALQKAEMPDLAKCIKMETGHYGLFVQPPGCANQMST